LIKRGGCKRLFEVEVKKEDPEHTKKVRRRIEEKIRHFNGEKIEALAVVLDVDTNTEKK
jgi:hypothetical protein